MPETKIFLHENMFGETERILLVNANFKVTLFRYSTGVCAVQITNGLINLIILPFQGQQVWRMDSQYRHLTMKSIFDEPEQTTRFGLNYGGFLIHCGLTANGNPSANDTHPLHGELPNCRYPSAYLVLGTDGEREYVALGGKFVYRNSLEYHYAFEPEVRVFAGSGVAKMDIHCTNFRSKPMKYMYMAHINWLPVDGSRLVYSADPQMTEVFKDTFGLPTYEQQRFSEYVDQVAKNPRIADIIDPINQVYDPELCMYAAYQADENGFAHAMQVFPEGDAGYVSFRTRELPNAVRWYARTGDEDALAFAIPATNNHLGFSRNDEKGLIHQIPAHSSLEMCYMFGTLSKEEAQKMENNIRSIQ